MKKLISLCLIGLISPINLNAQNHAWDLRECCSYAVEHNISIKQRENNREQRALQLSTAKNQRLPDLNASASESFSFGRGLTLDNESSLAICWSKRSPSGDVKITSS